MVRRRKGPSKTVSIKDVARLAGVSITTVSRVINKATTVKPKHRAKVLEAIKELKFSPSVFAQRLATGKSNVVALVIPRYEGIFYSFYALELIRGVGTLCEALKMDLLLHLTDAQSSLNVRGVGGIIFADLIGNKRQLEEALAQHIPSVVINNTAKEYEVTSVYVDNVGGAQQAVKYLISLGHKKIAHITGDVITQAAADRFEGYKRALAAAKIPLQEKYIYKTDYSRGQARSAAEHLLKALEPATAVFVASDSMALEVMTVAKEMGKQLPQDISIVGFDDNPSGLYGPVALTTVRQPLVKMAQEGVKLLLALMTGKKTDVERVALPTELVIRESCVAPRTV